MQKYHISEVSGRLPKVLKYGVSVFSALPVFSGESAEMVENTEGPDAGRSAEIAVNIENTESPHAGRSAEMAVNIENTESHISSKSAKMAENIETPEIPHAGRSAEMAINIENTETHHAGRPAKIAVNIKLNIKSECHVAPPPQPLPNCHLHMNVLHSTEPDI